MMPTFPPLTCLTQDTSVTRLTHTGESASASYTRRVVEARPVFALVNVCNTHTRACAHTHTCRETERHAHGIFTQLINISATLFPSLSKYVLLAAKGIKRGLIHLHRLDCGKKHRSSREAGPRYPKKTKPLNLFCGENAKLEQLQCGTPQFTHGLK